MDLTPIVRSKRYSVLAARLPNPHQGFRLVQFHTKCGDYGWVECTLGPGPNRAGSARRSMLAKAAVERSISDFKVGFIGGAGVNFAWGQVDWAVMPFEDFGSFQRVSFTANW